MIHGDAGEFRAQFVRKVFTTPNSITTHFLEPLGRSEEYFVKEEHSNLTVLYFYPVGNDVWCGRDLVRYPPKRQSIICYDDSKKDILHFCNVGDKFFPPDFTVVDDEGLIRGIEMYFEPVNYRVGYKYDVDRRYERGISNFYGNKRKIQKNTDCWTVIPRDRVHDELVNWTSLRCHLHDAKVSACEWITAPCFGEHRNCHVSVKLIFPPKDLKFFVKGFLTSRLEVPYHADQGLYKSITDVTNWSIVMVNPHFKNKIYVVKYCECRAQYVWEHYNLRMEDHEYWERILYCSWSQENDEHRSLEAWCDIAELTAFVM